MHTTKAIQKYRQNELKLNISDKGSWHKDYDSAYIFVGNLNYGMNQGDIAIVFSQFGQIVDLHLIRDKVTGKSKGYAFLAYQDQRSTILAVDNFNGADICGRTIRVDHIKRFKPPKQFLQINDQINNKQYRPTGPDGKGWGIYRKADQQQKQKIQKYQQARQYKKEITQRQLGRK